MINTDGLVFKAGDYDDSKYKVDFLNITPGEALYTGTLYDSGWGYVSIRKIQLATTMGGSISAGPDGYDDLLSLDKIIKNQILWGFVAWVNPDNFINGLALCITSPPSSTPSITQTAPFGNTGDTGIYLQLPSPVTYLGVRWDGDKVRGFEMTSENGKKLQAGGSGDAGYTLTTTTFSPGLTLEKASLYSSGYGDTSIIKITFTTADDNTFSAGESDGNDTVNLDEVVAGKVLWGFVAWVNPDHFINGLSLSVAC
jgi:hypothetical protein